MTTPAFDTFDVNRWADHEAGHTVAVLVLGLAPTVAMIRRDPADVQATGSGGMVDFDRSNSCRGHCWRLAVVMFAGAAAERISGRYPAYGTIGGGDLANVDRITAGYPSIRREDCEAAAEAIVRGNWSAVERFAAALLEHGELDGAELRALWEASS